MLPYGALCQMHDLVDEIDKRGIKGSIVEMGCWNGGCGAFMSWVTKRNKSNRHIWLFDSFEGLPEVSEEDGQWAKNKNLKIRDKNDKIIKSTELYIASENKVNEVFDKAGCKNDNVHIMKGFFQETIPKTKKEIGDIAILRLDGDIYESTKYCLDELYDSVVKGGYIIIDDFHLVGCRRALYEFFYKNNISPHIKYGPYGSYGGRAYFSKE